MSLRTETMKFISEYGCNVSSGQWRIFQSQHPGLRIKFYNDESVKINFQGRGPWFTPSEFRETMILNYEKQLIESTTSLYRFLGREGAIERISQLIIDNVVSDWAEPTFSKLWNTDELEMTTISDMIAEEIVTCAEFRG